MDDIDTGTRETAKETDEKFIFECREVEIGMLFFLQKDEYSSIPHGDLRSLLETHTSHIKWQQDNLVREVKHKKNTSCTAIFFPVQAGNEYRSCGNLQEVCKHVKEAVESKEEIFGERLQRAVHAIKLRIQQNDPKLPNGLRDIDIFFTGSIGATKKERAKIQR